MKAIYKCQLGLAFLLLIMFGQAFTAPMKQSPKQRLFNQIIIGEMMYRDDFINNAFNKLERFALDDPEFLVYKIRFLIKKKQDEKALLLLNKIPVNSPYYQQAKFTIELNTPAKKHALMQAKILILSGQYNKAIKAFDTIFKQEPPSMLMSMEYWSLIAKDPKRHALALEKLEQLYIKFKALGLMSSAMAKPPNWQYNLIRDIAGVWVDLGEQALKKKQYKKAEQSFNQALKRQGNNYEAWIGLGELSLELNQLQKAESAFKKAHEISQDGNVARHGLVSVYKRQSIKKAINYLQTLTKAEQKKMLLTRQELETSLLQQNAESYKRKGQLSRAIKTLNRALRLSPNDVWLTYDLALIYRDLGKKTKGLNLLKRLKASNNNRASGAYALALYLASIDRTRQALSALKSIPGSQKDAQVQRMISQLNVNLIFNQANALYDQGNHEAAYRILLKKQRYLSALIQLGDWHLVDKDYQKALYFYKKALKKEATNDSAVIGMMEAYIGLNKPSYVRKLLAQKPWRTYLSSLNNRRKLANIFSFLGEDDTAYRLLKQGENQAIASPKELTTALYLKTLAMAEQKRQNFSAAKRLFEQAMVKSKIAPSYPPNDEVYSFHTRNNSEDNWLQRNLRLDAADLYQQQLNRFTLQHDMLRLNGAPGISDFKSEDTVLKYGRPFGDGRISIRADKVTLNAGEFQTIDGEFVEDFGTCTNGCNKGFIQQKSGYSAMVQWQSPQWLVNLGVTPIGFDVFNWIGDISYQGSYHDVGWVLSAIHEPYTNSLLSFAGTQDPNSSLIWGGAVATGAELSLSYDQGKAHGFWGSLNLARITGKNVITNQRAMLNSGYYYKLINENNRRLTIGLINLLWHFDKDLNHYTLGHGGYFSPQFYTSFAIPINYRFRNDKWSFEVGGSGSWTHSRTSDILKYPLEELVPDLNETPNDFYRGGRGSTFGYRFLAAVERRLTSHFIFGGMIDIQRSPDFTPSQAVIYLKYTIEPWQGDLDMPINPINTYVNVR